MIYSQLGKLGRLGNQLWQVAGTVGLSYTNKDAPPYFPKWEYAKYFSVPSEYFTDNLQGTESYHDAQRIDPRERVYLQDFKLFEEWQDEVRLMLQPSELALKQLKLRFGKDLILEATYFTSVHVRRGDYLKVQDYHPLLPISYYREALVMCEGPFMFFSDDIDWCKRWFRGLDSVFFVEGTPRQAIGPQPMPGAFNDHEDLFLMSLCREHIIANSSYSWWGAFLTYDSQVIYPSRWYGPAAMTANASLMFPQAWQRIEVKDD